MAFPDRAEANVVLRDHAFIKERYNMAASYDTAKKPKRGTAHTQRGIVWHRGEQRDGKTGRVRCRTIDAYDDVSGMQRNR